MFVLSCILFPLGMLGRISFFDQAVNAYWYEIPWTAWIVMNVYWHARTLLDTRYLYALAMFLAILVVSFALQITTYSAESNMMAALFASRLVIYLIGVGIVLMPQITTQLPNQLAHMLLSSIITLALAQFIFAPDMWWLYPSGWDPHYMRMVGTFLDSSLSSSVYGVLLLFVLTSPKIRFRKVYLAMLGAIFLLTFARGAYVAIIAALIIFAFQMKQYKLTLLAIATSLILLVAIPKPSGEAGQLLRTSTIQSRVADYQEAITIWSEHPLLGVGYNHIRDVKSTGYAKQAHVAGFNHAGSGFHSSYLVILVTMGVAGLIAYVATLFAWWKSRADMRPIIAFLAVYSIFDNVLLHPNVLFIVSSIMLLQTSFAQSSKR